MFNPAAIPPTLSVIIGLGLAMLSVIRGRFRLQNILFALVILWWSLISAAFVLHQICAGDTQTILEIERVIHVVYVFVPVINLLFFHSLLGIKRTWLVAVFSLPALHSVSRCPVTRTSPESMSTVGARSPLAGAPRIWSASTD